MKLLWKTLALSACWFALAPWASGQTMLPGFPGPVIPQQGSPTVGNGTNPSNTSVPRIGGMPMMGSASTFSVGQGSTPMLPSPGLGGSGSPWQPPAPGNLPPGVNPGGGSGWFPPAPGTVPPNAGVPGSLPPSVNPGSGGLPVGPGGQALPPGAMMPPPQGQYPGPQYPPQGQYPGPQYPPQGGMPHPGMMPHPHPGMMPYPNPGMMPYPPGMMPYPDPGTMYPGACYPPPYGGPVMPVNYGPAKIAPGLRGCYTAFTEEQPMRHRDMRAFRLFPWFELK